MTQTVFVLMVGKASTVNFVGVKLGMDCSSDDISLCKTVVHVAKHVSTDRLLGYVVGNNFSTSFMTRLVSM